MNINKILFPTDFSDSSKAALGYASTLAAETGATLYIAHVFDNTPTYLAGYGGVGAVPDFSQEIAKENRALLEQVKPTKKGVEYVHEFVEGTPVHQLVALADREKIDLIVMGTHGRTGLSRLLMGSIAEGVLREANCPVLTVKQPMLDEEETDTDAAEENAARSVSHQPSIKSKLSLH